MPYGNPTRSFNNVKRLSLRGTGISKIKINTGPTTFCLGKLEHLNLAGNTPPMLLMFYKPKVFNMFPSILQNGVEESEYWGGKAINIADASNLFVQKFYTRNNYCKLVEQDFGDYFQTMHNKYIKPPFPHSDYITKDVWPLGMR